MERIITRFSGKICNFVTDLGDGIPESSSGENLIPITGTCNFNYNNIEIRIPQTNCKDATGLKSWYCRNNIINKIKNL